MRLINRTKKPITKNFYVLPKRMYLKPEYHYRLLGSDYNGTTVTCIYVSNDIIEIKRVLEINRSNKKYAFLTIQEQVVFTSIFKEISKIDLSYHLMRGTEH